MDTSRSTISASASTQSAQTQWNGTNAVDVGNQLIEEIKRAYPENNQLSDDLLRSLHFVFQAPLLSALELIDKNCVSCLESPSGRNLFQIIGASGTPYICFPGLKYCSCQAFHFSVLKKAEHIMCKHVLAMKLSEAMGLSKTVTVTDKDISNMIDNMD